MTGIMIFALALIALALAGLAVKPGADGAGGEAGSADLKQLLSAALVGLGGLFLPSDPHRRLKLVTKLQQAGMYGKTAPEFVLGLAVALLLASAGSAAALLAAERVTPANAVLVAAGLAFGSVLLPCLWVRSNIKSRQKQIREALTDALDIIVVCIQGGLSLPQSLERVSQELDDIHPLLAQEMDIVHREVYLGASPGEALVHFANRFETGELRALASVVVHAQKYGAPLGPTLRTYADDLRLTRKQAVETLAQKSAVKLVFPIAFCFFPAFILVALGPSIVDLVDTVSDLGKRF